MVDAVKKENTEIACSVYASACRTSGSEGAVVYGIRAVCSDWDRVVEFDDISPDREKAERLKEILEDADIDPDQIKYIVEDFLEQIYS